MSATTLCHQVVHSHRCRCSVALAGDGMQTAAVKAVDYAQHRSCECPGITRMHERRTHGYTIQPQLLRTGQAVVAPQVAECAERRLYYVHAVTDVRLNNQSYQ